MPLPQNVYTTLQSIFGFAGFRPNQEPIVGALLEGRDVFGIMPTGGGKSLCYQLPACLREGTAVVVSPLISLMKDQVDAASENGIAGAVYNSSLNESARRQVLARLFSGQLKLLYVSPERLALDGFLELLAKVKISCFAIDEAHCISEWGHDFRPDYLCLSQLTQLFPHVPLAAFTATATRRVQDDIATRLGLRNPLLVRASFDRPNLLYRIALRDNANAQILKFVSGRPNDTGIVYRMTRKSVDSTAQYLAAHKISALPYHAGLSDKARQAHQEAFNRDEIRVIVATIAFGMGIDKSNVRYVVHGDLPKNMESYYQETGRGGRDGEPSDCLMLYGPGDIAKVRYFIDDVPDEAERKRLMDGLYAVVNYAQTNQCRRKAILGYFGESYEKHSCGMCDICLGEVETSEATAEAQMLLSAAVRTGERFGSGHLIDIVCGTASERMQRLGHDRLPTFGVGKAHPKTYWRALFAELTGRQIIRVTDDQYPIVKLLPRAREILKGGVSFSIVKQRTAAAGSRKRKAGTHGGAAVGLFDYLRSVRTRLAREASLPPYMVFTDVSLREMAELKPTSEREMLLITGVGQRKMERFGQPFILAIKEFAALTSSERVPL